MKLKTNILPEKHEFAKIRGVSNELNYRAICVFAATGFFMDDDTFWKNKICLRPGTEYEIDDDGYVANSSQWFNWYHEPKEVTFTDALKAYSLLLEEILVSQIQDNPVILPLSGGLDSRSIAMILKKLPNPVHAFSYSFANGYPEHLIAEKIAQECDFDFSTFKIEKGYLWKNINKLATINGCYSEFTHPRQMAVLNQLKSIDGVFALGHWGDVFFDKGVSKEVNNQNVINVLQKKMVKKGGMELANLLWEHWDLEGNFKDYLVSRIESAFNQIKIDNLSAKVRAFKTTQWAHRWTTTNLSIFKDAHSIKLPYYDDRMCQFVCTTKEDYLADRRLQIAHLQQDKGLSSITWQDHRPFNLNNYEKNKSPYNLPYRVINKLIRELKSIQGTPYVQRNWELQFIGKENDSQLTSYLFNSSFNKFIPQTLTKEIYNNFKTKDSVNYSHSVSMLLTLSLWYNKLENK